VVVPSASDPEYDFLVIDERSTVSNADLIKVLEKTSFRLILLVGDVYQIEARDVLGTHSQERSIRDNAPV